MPSRTEWNQKESVLPVNIKAKQRDQNTIRVCPVETEAMVVEAVKRLLKHAA